MKMRSRLMLTAIILLSAGFYLLVDWVVKDVRLHYFITINFNNGNKIIFIENVYFTAGYIVQLTILYKFLLQGLVGSRRGVHNFNYVFVESSIYEYRIHQTGKLEFNGLHRSSHVITARN